MRPSFSLSLSLAISVLAAVAHAELVFESPELVVKPKLGEKVVTAEFKFKNTGAAPVTITRVHSGCGCTVPEKPPEPVAPGASASIPVTYKPGDRQGLQSQQIEIETADGKVQQLHLSIDLPVRINFSPRLLLFRGADQTERTAVITFGDEGKSELLEVDVRSQDFALVGTPALENRELKLTFRHVGAADADARASVRIRSKDSAGGEHTDILYLRHSP